MKTKMTIEIEYEADPREYTIRNHLIHRLEDPNYNMHRHQLFGALGIVGSREVKVNVKFEEVK